MTGADLCAIHKEAVNDSGETWKLDAVFEAASLEMNEDHLLDGSEEAGSISDSSSAGKGVARNKTR